MSVVAIIQARMSSQRLPGKVLMDIAGEPMIFRVWDRLLHCRSLDTIAVGAANEPPVSNPLWDALVSADVRHYFGEVDQAPSDVLSRYIQGARLYDADVIVRITADCPLIEPTVVDAAVAKLTADPSRYDFVSNGIRRTYPKGLDVEVMWRDTLERLNRLATTPEDREHCTLHAYRTRPDLFRLGEIWDDQGDNSDLRWTVDYPADLEHVRQLYGALGMADRFVGYRDIVAYERAQIATQRASRFSAG